MIRIILFLYAILNVTMATSFMVTGYDDPDSLPTQNDATVAALMGRAHHQTQQNLEAENHHLRSTVGYLQRTVDGQFHKIQRQKDIISDQQRQIEWQQAEIERLRWNLEQAHRCGPPPPAYSPPAHTSGRADMEASPPYHAEDDAKKSRAHTTTAALKRFADAFTPRLTKLEDTPLYKEFKNHTLVELLGLLATKETDLRSKIMINVVIGRKIAAERQGRARAESITYFKEAQTLSAQDESSQDLWKFATIGLGLAYCDNRENLRGLLELHKLKEETKRFVTEQYRVGYFQASLHKGWEDALKATDWLKDMREAEQKEIVQKIIEAARFYGLIE